GTDGVALPSQLEPAQVPDRTAELGDGPFAGASAILKSGPVARGARHEGVDRTILQAGPDHQARLGPRIGVVHAAHFGLEFTVAGERLIGEMQPVRAGQGVPVLPRSGHRGTIPPSAAMNRAL